MQGLSSQPKVCSSITSPLPVFLTFQDFPSISSRVKRRAHIHITNDENAEPTLSDPVRDNTGHNGMHLDELDGSKHLSSSSSLVKRSPIGNRVALSPSKANGQRKADTVPRMSSAGLGRLRS